MLDREGGIREFNEKTCSILQNQPYHKYFERKGDKQLCFSLEHRENRKYQIASSYMIGVDWVVENELPIYIEPKLNDDVKEVDFLKMLFEALEEPENFNHLTDLYTVDFNAPQIAINQRQDLLTPLLLLEYLSLLKRIVRKGIKKSYYSVTQNINSRVKGKILINASIKQNHTRQKLNYNVCQYEEYGVDSLENRLLKKALVYAQVALNKLKGTSKDELSNLLNYVRPAFANVGNEVEIREVVNLKSNPMFKEYTDAIRIAKMILKKYGYNISKVSEEVHKTPPFWIDMSKLFELYVFKQLKSIFPLPKEVKYHQKMHYQEPDFIVNSKTRGIQLVVDAKYKPKYESQDILKEDARQVSGYARLKKMYVELGIEDHTRVIDALIVYSSQNKPSDLTFERLLEDTSDAYVRFYKVGISLPFMI